MAGGGCSRPEQPGFPSQHSDSDSDPESSAPPPPIPSAVPVTGESFCDCDSPSESSFCNSLRAGHRGKDCRCGEEDERERLGPREAVRGELGAGLPSSPGSPLADFDWVWDDLNKSSATLLSCDNRKVSFHTEYSCGTAAIRGTKELGEGQHFWEIKMTSPVYGTDMVSGRGGRGGGSTAGAQAPAPRAPHGLLCPPCSPQMVGIGTSDVDLDKYHHTFCSLLGRDEDSWGLSYTGAWGGPAWGGALGQHGSPLRVPRVPRAPPPQGRQDELLVKIRPGLHHRRAPGHLARHADLLQEQEVHR